MLRALYGQRFPLPHLLEKVDSWGIEDRGKGWQFKGVRGTRLMEFKGLNFKALRRRVQHPSLAMQMARDTRFVDL